MPKLPKGWKVISLIYGKTKKNMKATIIKTATKVQKFEGRWVVILIGKPVRRKR